MDNDIRTRIWESWSKQKQIKALTQAEKEICSPPDNFEKYEWNVCTRYFKDNEIARVALLEGGDCEDIKLTALGKTLLAGLKEDMHKEPQPEQAAPEPQQMELKDLLPEELKSNEAVRVFQKAIDAKLITYSPEGLKWSDTKQLLAYFATKVSEKFSLTSILDRDGNKTTSWRPFEILFNKQGLKGAKQNWMRLNTKFVPTGFEKVDALF